MRVAVVERDARAVGASIRNFGHICTTPQTGRALDCAWSAREKWLRLAEQAGFEITRIRRRPISSWPPPRPASASSR